MQSRSRQAKELRDEIRLVEKELASLVRERQDSERRIVKKRGDHVQMLTGT